MDVISVERTGALLHIVRDGDGVSDDILPIPTIGCVRWIGGWDNRVEVGTLSFPFTGNETESDARWFYAEVQRVLTGFYSEKVSA